MTLRTYRAFSMTDALEAVKRDLGVDAAILHTRTFRRGGVFGLGRRTVVEVTASRNDDSEAIVLFNSQRTTQPAVGRSSAAMRAYAGAGPASTSQPAPGSLQESFAAHRAGPAIAEISSAPIDLLAAIEQHKREADERRRPSVARPMDRAPAAMMEAKAPSASTVVTSRAPGAVEPVQPEGEHGWLETRAPGAPHPRSISPDSVEKNNQAGPGCRQEHLSQAPVAQRFILTRVDDAKPGQRREITNRVARSNAEATQNPLLERIAQPVRTRAAEQQPPTSTASEEMRAIRDMVGQILQHQTAGRGGATPAMPKALFDIYLRLIGQEVSEEIADPLALRVQSTLSPVELDDSARVRDAIRTELINLIPVQPTNLGGPAPDGRPLTIALIGPTGVGKTTTLAKLAATFKLHHGRRVGLITSDTYRIAAVDQLRTYANIISVPLRVVLTPQEMCHACGQFRDCDVVLIDTAGRSQRDRERLAELSRFIAAAAPHEVHLVLSATAGEQVLAQEAGSFSAVRCDRLIVTKIDEAVSYGLVLNLLRQVAKPLSFITTGQEVPDHLEPASAGRIAELILG